MAGTTLVVGRCALSSVLLLSSFKETQFDFCRHPVQIPSAQRATCVRLLRSVHAVSIGSLGFLGSPRGFEETPGFWAHSIGFERVPEPWMIIVADQYTPWARELVAVATVATASGVSGWFGSKRSR